MKMSFSLSSLQPSSNSLERRKPVSMPLDRPYNSLTKKRKDPKQVQCQRMWTNREDSKDDFWAAIRSNYDYIMDTNLIDSCKEANGELTWDEADVSTQSWSLKEVSCQFSELYSWLRVLQELVYSKEENLLDKSLRAAHMEELRRRAYRRKLFNEQAEKLVACTPALKDEVAWRVNHLNAKWELVEQIMAPVERTVSDEQDVSADFEHEVRCLRKWLREMESRLKPLSFHVDWTLAELEEKAMEHMILQRDIEAHGRIVSSVVKLSERVYKQRQQQQSPQQQPLRISRSLERRWHLLFLRALEWQCHIETLASRASNKSGVSCQCSSESDEEPVTKQPRLSRGRQSRGSGRESPGSATTTPTTSTSATNFLRSSRSEKKKRLTSRVRRDSGTNNLRNEFSDSDASSESRSVDEGSYFEDELCQFCVMDAKFEEAESSARIVPHGIAIDTGDQGEEADVEEEERDDMPPTPDTAPMTSSTTTTIARNLTAEQQQSKESVPSKETLKRRRSPTPSSNVSPTEEAASFNTSDRKAKNCAIFYFKHMDTDSEVDCCQTNEESPNMVDDSSEEEWTYTSSRANNYVCSEERKTNVVVRLDFNETPRVTVNEKVRFVATENDERINEAKENNDEVQEQRSSKRSTKNSDRKDSDPTTTADTPEKDSDDEAKSDKGSIQRLIKEVEKLVREERHATLPRTFPPLIFEEKKGVTMNHRAKYARIKEWLRLNSVRGHEPTSRTGLQPLDSCDASGEYTTEESDGERQSVSSEDLQSSVATYRRFESGALARAQSQSMSQEIIEDFDKTPVNETRPVLLDNSSSTPKVVMRSRQKSNGPRPWSVSCISQITSNGGLNQVNDSISQFSISQSETALHQLIVSPPTKSISLDATGLPKSFNNSTSTLLEESIICQDGRAARNSSLRRKKSRLRKKNLGRKSGSSSECVSGNQHSAGSDGSLSQQRSPRKTNANRVLRGIPRDCHGRSTTLVKSGSFSGCTVHQQLTAETTIVGDPTLAFAMPCCRDSVASTETEGEERDCIKGCSTYEDSLLDTVLNSKELCNRQFNVDSDVEMNSLGNNSFSEQAWDNYQEKYMSEPYSEAPDLETARRLLEFGDDYRNFLDSQSDCASSMSALPGSSPPMPRNRMRHETIDTTEDSDSDVEDIRNVVEKSQSQCVLAENLFVRTNGTLPQDCVEVECACRENLRCLNTLLDSISGSFRAEKYAKQVRGAIERWESLASRVEESRMASSLHQELSTMLLEFKASHDRLVAYEIVLEQPHVLDERINRITAELIALRERKAAMLALNVSAHRLITDLGASTSLIFTALKDGVADLYRVWDETFQRGNQRLCALQTVQQFSIRLLELQSDLRRDKDTLAVLDVALQAGATSEVASSVRHVARLLSEKQEVHSQNETVIMNDTTIAEVTSCPLAKFTDQSATLLSQEGGSLSDSGISDSGSEQELSERERRLAALRRLTRSLETQLEPGSEALVELWKRVDDAESDLRDLQKQCRELIVRTAASVENRTVKRMAGQLHCRVDKRKKASLAASYGDTEKEDSEMDSSLNGTSNKSGLVADTGDPDNEPDLPHSWIWRILRAALPFQLALVALFCAACLLEPHCCEAANTLNLSLTPQLRYVRGPPPV